MLRSALVAATLAAGAFAVPQITSPEAGASLPASAGSITVEWKDDGKAPKVAALKGYTIQLIVGGNTETDSVSDGMDERERRSGMKGMERRRPGFQWASMLTVGAM